MIECSKAIKAQETLSLYRSAAVRLHSALNKPGYVVAAAKDIEESFGMWIEAVGGLTPETCKDCRSVKLAMAMGVRVEC